MITDKERAMVRQLRGMMRAAPNADVLLVTHAELPDGSLDVAFSPSSDFHWVDLIGVADQLMRFVLEKVEPIIAGHDGARDLNVIASLARVHRARAALGFTIGDVADQPVPNVDDAGHA